MNEEILLSRKIQAELNLEKWCIWQPTSARTKPKEKILERQIQLPNGNQITARVEVGFTNKGVLTTDDQKVYYALIKMWEDDGRPPTLYFSLRRLANVLQRPWGKDTAKYLSQSLIRLKATPFVWKNSYYDSTTKETASVLEAFNILANLKIVEKDAYGHTTKQACSAQFNEFIDSNLRNNHTKPVFFNTIIKFERGITQLLYRYIDLIMADKSHYERRSEALFEDLGLDGEDYKKPSVRKRILEKSIKELDGCQISTGSLKATIKQTEDNKDYKAVFNKSKVKGAAKPKTITVEAIPTPEPVKTVIPPPNKQKTPVSSATHDLVNYFYQLFHNLDTSMPTDKELSQAASLINGYGLDLAKYTIEFAKTSSEKTNFHPQSFGGIVQYAPKAAADFTQKQKQQQAQLQQQHAQQNALLEQEEEICAQMQTHLKTLLLDRYESLEKTVKQQLVLEMPWLAKLQPTAIMFRSALYKEMLHQAKQGLGQ